MEACIQMVSSICAWLIFAHSGGYQHCSKYCFSISILLSLIINKKFQLHAMASLKNYNKKETMKKKKVSTPPIPTPVNKRKFSISENCQRLR